MTATWVGMVRRQCVRCGKAWQVSPASDRYPYVCPECRPVTGDESGEKASTY